MGARHDKLYPLIYRMVTGESLPDDQKVASDQLLVTSTSIKHQVPTAT
ncbi:MAG: hypothetical protein H6766_07825 [Candidatus Peribacteria bacterium]|nr:MAG: hypothetical protein H6766_07825 [Candidatus Peribacteria bacterium]